MWGMARFESRPDLDQIIAATVGRRAVDRMKGQVESGARRRAPDAKAWITARDERVRPSHADADGQTIPDNLRYQLKRMTYVRKGRDEHGKAINPAGGWKETDGYDLAHEPRDPRLPDEQKLNCRCESAPLPEAVARSIHATETVVESTKARAEVESYFNRVAESEFGTGEDHGLYFMTLAAREAAARLRG